MPDSKVVQLTERGIGRTLRIAVGRPGSTKPGAGSNRVKNRLMPWEELVKTLSGEPIRTHETVAEYTKMGKEAQLAVKDQGYFVGGHCRDGVRKKTHMEQRDMLSIDGDFATEDWQGLLSLGLMGYAWLAHTTHKHTETQPRYRLLLPLARPVNEFEYAFLCRHVANMVHKETFDPAGHRWVQAMFWPSVSKDGEYHCIHEAGTWLDPEEAKADYADWRDVDQWPGTDREASSLRHSMQKAGNPLEKPGLVGAFCRAMGDIYSAMELIPDAYEPTSQDNRFSYSDGQSKNGAIVYDDQWLYSHHGSDPCGGMLVNAFDMVRIHKFGDMDQDAPEGTPINRTPSYKAMKEFAQTNSTVAQEMVRDRVEDDPLNDFEDIQREDAEQESDDDWYKHLAITAEGSIKSTLRNASLILAHDPGLKDCVFYDEFSGGLKAERGVPGYRMRHQYPTEWRDQMDLQVRVHIERKYKVALSKDMMADAVMQVGAQTPRHAILDWLNSLSWDGRPRVDTLWVDYFRLPDNPYTRESARAFMVAGCNRVMHPGSKFDYVPILEGKQGVRKSSFWEYLAGSQFFTTLKTFDTKAAAEILQGVWVAEVPELEPFGRAAEEAVKAFFVDSSPKFRAAYSRHAKATPRQCVFAGTTNKHGGYLKDETGNRRFWPLGYVSHMIDTDRLEAERAQIWAEAYAIAKKGDKHDLYLSPEAEKLAVVEQTKRAQVDEWTGIITEWLDKPAAVARYSDTTDDFDEVKTEARERACIPEIWTECLGRSMDALRPWDRSRIKAAVEATGEWRVTEHMRRFGARFGRQKSIERI